MRRWTLAGGTGSLILLAAGLTGCSAATSVAPQRASASGTVAVREGTAAPVPSSRAADSGTGVAGPSASPPLSGAAASALGSLEVKGRAPKSGYSRAQFGQAWADVDRNGCDTRNDILARDLQNVTFGTVAAPLPAQRARRHRPRTGPDRREPRTRQHRGVGGARPLCTTRPGTRPDRLRAQVGGRR